jgi:hypothetical protein
MESGVGEANVTIFSVTAGAAVSEVGAESARTNLTATADSPERVTIAVNM